MDMSQLYESRAYAGRELLKQDVAIRISETINIFGFYFNSLVFAEEESSLEQPQAEYVEYIENAMRANNDFNKQKWLEKAERVAAELKKKPEETTRKVDPVIYREFLKKFAELWIETKENIDKKFWATKTTKADIVKYFENASKGEHNPRDLLNLFYQYMESLTKCGILYFKYTTLKTGESWREGTS